MKGKLRKEFIERMEAVLYGDIVEEEVEDLIHDFCDEIENRLLDVYYELKRIEGLTEIDIIRNAVEELVTICGRYKEVARCVIMTGSNAGMKRYVCCVDKRLRRMNLPQV